MQKINEKKFGFSRNFYFLCIYIRKKPKNKKHMKTILIEKTKRIVLDYSFDSKAMKAKKAGFKKLETMQVDDEKAQIIEDKMMGEKIEFNEPILKIEKYVKAILKIDYEGNVKETKTHKDFVIFHTWQSILNANTDYIVSPFVTADSTYHHQTYEMKIMCAYGFKFARVRDLNAFQYPGQLHGNKTLLKTKYSHFEL